MAERDIRSGQPNNGNRRARSVYDDDRRLRGSYHSADRFIEREPDSAKRQTGSRDNSNASIPAWKVGPAPAKRPNPNRSGSSRQGADRTGAKRPNQGRPNQGRPNQGRPNQGRPNQSRPNQSRPNQGRTGSDRQGSKRPISNRPVDRRVAGNRRPGPRPAQKQRGRGRRQNRSNSMILLLFGVVVILGLMIWGITALLGKGKKAEEPTRIETEAEETEEIKNLLVLSKKGKITGILHEKFEEPYYNETELRSMVESEVSSYNALAGSDFAVKVEDFKIEDGVANISISYDSDEDYRSYNGTSVYTGTVKQLEEEGVLIPTQLTDAKGKQDLSADQFDTIKKKKAAVIGENTLVKTSGVILYHSPNVEITGKKEAVVKVDELSEERAIIIWK